MDINPKETKKLEIPKQNPRKFGLTIGILFIALSGLLFWFEKQSYPYFLLAGIILVFLGLITPNILLPAEKIWMLLAVILNRFMTRLILGFLFYLVLTPTNLISRLLGKRFLDLKIDKSGKSYWNYRDTKLVKKSQYEKQF